MSEIAPHILDGKCRYRDGTPARILCYDAPGPMPVIALGDTGVTRHTCSGRYVGGDSESIKDLIPLPPEPRVPRRVEMAYHPSLLGNGKPSMAISVYQDGVNVLGGNPFNPEKELSIAEGWEFFEAVELLPGYELVKVREVLPEQEEPVRKFPPTTPAREFSFSAVYSPDSGVTQIALIARSMEELRLMWNSFPGNYLPLDESKVQRVKISGRQTDAAGVPLEGGGR